jgi:hypothetical protein
MSDSNTEYENPRFKLQTYSGKGKTWRTVHTYKNKHRAQKAYLQDVTDRKQGGVRLIAPDGEELAKFQVGA